MFLASLGVLHLQAQTRAPSATPSGAESFVGSERCASCHQREHAAWQGSQHAHALRHARGDAVLGDFGDTTFEKDGVVSTFVRRDGRFFIDTQGPDGKPGQFEVRFTLGLAPLQQYLVEMPGGRLQAFGIAWDTRPAEAGGQRWFDLYPGQKLAPGDPLHWTGIQQTANYMCIDCHVTNLRKGFDLAANAYSSSWTEPGVGCEACHGPGGMHAADPRQRIGARFAGRAGIVWGTDPSARPRVPAPSDGRITEGEVCARCHARRAQLTDAIHAGQPYADGFRPALLERGLFHPDGQMLDEVFNYGSFLQSRMFAQGVSCSDCHDPHTQKLRADGDALCGQCHQPATYATRTHHFHDPTSQAGRCVSCHMPTVTYMVVDPRHDHSFRVPRADQAAVLGTPDACTTCHGDKPPGWAARELQARLGRAAAGFQTFAEAFEAADRGAPGAVARLARIANTPLQPAIVRASAIARMRVLDPTLVGIDIARALADPDPLIRATAAGSFVGDPGPHVGALASLLRDPMRWVRTEAARALAGPAEVRLSDGDRAAFQAALDDYVAVQHYNADRGEAHFNLALLEIRRGNGLLADDHLRRTIAIDATFVPAYVRLADLYRGRREEARAEEILRQATERNPRSALAHHALGLSLVRQRRLETALATLSLAAELEPDTARYGYVLAVALDQAGRRPDALRILDEVLRRHPNDGEALSAAAVWAAQRGDVSAALGYLSTLRLLRPDDRSIDREIERLRRLPSGR